MPVLYSMLIQFVENVTMQKTLLRRNSKVRIEVLEFGEHTILFETAGVSCKKNHRLSIAGNLVTSVKTVPFSFTAKVKSVSTIANKRQRLSVEFMQYDVPLWTDFLNYAQMRQDKCDEILKRVKGE